MALLSRLLRSWWWCTFCLANCRIAATRRRGQCCRPLTCGRCATTITRIRIRIRFRAESKVGDNGELIRQQWCCYWWLVQQRTAYLPPELVLGLRQNSATVCPIGRAANQCISKPPVAATAFAIAATATTTTASARWL